MCSDWDYVVSPLDEPYLWQPRWCDPHCYAQWRNVFVAVQVELNRFESAGCSPPHFKDDPAYFSEELGGRDVIFPMGLFDGPVYRRTLWDFI